MTDRCSYKIAYTHGGTFHFDDVLCSALLRIINPKIEIKRVMSEKDIVLSPDAVVYDIGNGEFNHHRNAKKMRPGNDVPFSSFGLIWQRYGQQLLQSIGYDGEYLQSVFDYIDSIYVRKVDIIDNLGYDENMDFAEYRVFLKFKAGWYEDRKAAECLFLQAVNYAELLLYTWSREAYAKLVVYNQAKALFEKALQDAQGRQYLALEKYLPCKLLFGEELKANGIFILIYPSEREGFVLESVDSQIVSFIRADLPCKQHIMFIHSSGFLMVAKTQEIAKTIAESVINQEKPIF